MRGRCGLALRMGIASAAGAMVVASLPPVSLTPLALVSFAGLFALLHRQGVARALTIGWAFGLGQFGAGLSWITESFQVDAETFGALAVPAVGGLAAALALFPALASAGHALVGRWQFARSLPLAAITFAALWAGSEWLRGHVLTGFPWNLAAYALVDRPLLRQPAAVFGSYGMSFLVVLAGAWLGAALLARTTARVVPLSLAVALAGSVAGMGLWLSGREARPDSGLRLRIVQGNIPQAEKWAPGSRARTLEKYLRLSAMPGDYDLLLWPETAFPGFLDEDAGARARTADSLPAGAFLLTGAPDRRRSADGVRYFNKVQAYGPAGELVESYAKHHLVPFGEYVPLRDWLPFERMVESLGDFTPGPGPRTLALPGVPPVAPAICYEIIFAGHVTDRLFRPDWIFNATNDAWFGTSIGPEQHLAAARMRAVEEGLPVIRAANTGISAVIDARGAVLARRELQQDAVIDAPLPPALPMTPYARYRDWMPLALVAAALAFGALGAVCARLLSKV